MDTLSFKAKDDGLYLAADGGHRGLPSRRMTQGNDAGEDCFSDGVDRKSEREGGARKISGRQGPKLLSGQRAEKGKDDSTGFGSKEMLQGAAMGD